VAGAFILKAEASEAELLSGEGFFIQKLLGPIVWPSSPSSGAVAAPDAYIQEYSPLIQNLINAVSQTQIYTSVLNLQDDDATPGWDVGRSRYSHAPELSVERDYIYSRLQALGLDVRYQGFSLSGTPLDNVEGTLNGWGPGSQVVYIVCAHYDSTSNDAYDAAPGADDNASGTAGVLEAARVLSQYRFKHTLRFVTFAGEEQGLIGSYYYAREARSTGTAIGGVLNLDMIAWDSNDDRVMELHAGTRGDSQTLGLAFQDANSTYGIGLAPQFITSGATTLSDHASFWNRDYPAILVIEDFQDFNPYYHNTSDTADKLNMPYATQLVQATVATLAELAEIIPPGIKVEHIGPTMAMAGEPIALVVQYANPSPTIATDVVISDTFSPGLTYFGENSGFPVTQPSSGSLVWQVGDMPPYGRSSFVVTASVGAGLPEGTQLTSTLSITGVTGWDDPEDNQAVWVGEVPWVYYLPVAFKEGD
jgi:uncharacterized repeat protein (TIGR01451 family)